jgi:hypothetical protein
LLEVAIDTVFRMHQSASQTMTNTAFGGQLRISNLGATQSPLKDPPTSRHGFSLLLVKISPLFTTVCPFASAHFYQNVHLNTFTFTQTVSTTSIPIPSISTSSASSASSHLCMECTSVPRGIIRALDIIYDLPALHQRWSLFLPRVIYIASDGISRLVNSS